MTAMVRTNTWLRTLPVFGAILAVFGLSMLVPWGVSRWLGDGAQASYLPTMMLTVFAGMGLRLIGPVRKPLPELQIRDGMLLVSMCWIVLPLVASGPLLMYFEQAGRPISFTWAYFEAMSGLTTTGATVLSGLDNLPASINVWRCFLQWIGGMGILVLAVAILPLLGVGGTQLFRAESTGPMKDNKLTPRIKETAKGLWSVYCVMSLACVLAYWWGGMSPLDAWLHMFSTMSLGGLSSHDASFAYFNSATLEWIAIFFMTLACGNFSLYFLIHYRHTFRPVFQDDEWRGSMSLLIGASLLVAGLLVIKDVGEPNLDTLRMSLFNVISVASTTGYSSTDYTLWPVFAPIFMIMLSGMVCSAGSTGSGIKMIRVLILIKQAGHEMTRIIHPRAVNPINVGGGLISGSTIFAVLAFMLVYGTTVLVLTFAFLLSDLSIEMSIGAALAGVNNLGPALGAVGPAGNFSAFNDFQLWVYCVAMLLGRLEILTFVVLFTPGFWRK